MILIFMMRDFYPNDKDSCGTRYFLSPLHLPLSSLYPSKSPISPWKSPVVGDVSYESRLLGEWEKAALHARDLQRKKIVKIWLKLLFCSFEEKWSNFIIFTIIKHHLFEESSSVQFSSYLSCFWVLQVHSSYTRLI